VTQAKAAYGPTLSLSGSHRYTTSRVRGTTLPSENDGFGTTAELSLSQPLFTSGRLAAGLDAARATKLIVRENLRATSQRLISDVVDAYISLQRDIELYGVAVEIHALLLQQRDVTMARFRLRDSTQPDLDQTNNRMELAAGRVISARAGVEVSAARYRNLVGTYPSSLAPPPPLLRLPTLDMLYAEAERANPNLAAAKYAEARSRAEVGAARASMMPQVSGFAALDRAPLSPYQNTVRQESAVAGVSLSMQLYSGGQMSSMARAAVDRNLSDQFFVEQARRDMREAIANDWTLLQAATDALPRYDAAVRAAESAVDGVKRQETSGIRTLRDVLDVTSDLLSARTSAVQARADVYLRHVAVLRDAGLLSIDMFSEVTPYDPNSYRPSTAAFAGLPLGPLLGPIDRLLLNERVRRAPVVREAAGEYQWPVEHPSPLPPVAGAVSVQSGTPD
ncbi:TolC family protein, partial [Sphingobium sp.]|uniref:TolC family protein n=1 Tax=Sphingobium sp. TaxID=1912891 RepID=UPI002BA4CDBA